MTLSSFILNGIELLYCAIDILLLHYFCAVHLTKKEMSKIKFSAIYIMTTVAIFLLTVQEFYSTYGSILSILFLVLYGFLVFDGKPKSKLTIVIFLYIMLGIVTLLTTTTVPMLFSLDASTMIQDPALRFILVFVTKAIVFFIIYLNEKHYKKMTQVLSLKSLFTFSVLVFLILILLFEFIYLNKDIPIDQLVVTMSLTFVACLGVIAIITLKYYNSREANVVYQLQLEESEQKNQEYIRIVNEQIEIMRLKHDIKNHLIVLESHIKEGSKEETLNYIEKLQIHPGLKTYVSTNNNVINAILNQKISEYQEIDFKVRYDGEFKIESSKLTIILGNALDNAIEAVQKNPTDKTSEIKIVLSENDELIKIFVANPIYVQPVIRNGKLVSQKESKFSGMGLENIQRAVDELSGHMKYEIEEDSFKLIILINK